MALCDGGLYKDNDKKRRFGFNRLVTTCPLTMSLTVLGTAANVLGVLTPIKDVGEIVKAIADSVEEVSYPLSLADSVGDLIPLIIGQTKSGIGVLLG